MKSKTFLQVTAGQGQRSLTREKGKKMTRKLLLAFGVIGLAVASAKTYTVNLYSSATFGSTELKPGTYTLEVKESKAILRQGKVENEADVKVESEPSKFNSTTVRYNNSDGKMQIQEIRLGGTHTKLVFNN